MVFSVVRLQCVFGGGAGGGRHVLSLRQLRRLQIGSLLFCVALDAALRRSFSLLFSLSLLLLPHTALTGALAVFAGAFVFRPLGGMMFGYIGDKSALFLLLCDCVCVCVCMCAFARVF